MGATCKLGAPLQGNDGRDLPAIGVVPEIEQRALIAVFECFSCLILR